ncbi:MAG TPA: N-acetyl-gamma-glutamyl-phosphate reductase [Desulfobulbaceae bacterium]|nr:N-acetyl-gamma-glutamyl-phosphate reductase [Desulfobulbaceae bacterium]
MPSPEKVSVAVIGASGYTGVELARLLSIHPLARLVAVTSRQYAGQRMATVFPSLHDICDLSFEESDIASICGRAEIIFTAVPHKTAMLVASEILAAGRKLIDLSADFRLRDAAVYEQWYEPHSAAEYLTEAVYGLPELYREEIKKARLIANPGCYPTSIILGLAPLLRAGIIDATTIIADSKSGTSGAGRGAVISSLYCEVADGFRPYKVGGSHRHIPEIEQELGQLHGGAVTITFTPHLLPISRGILSTIYARLKKEVSAEQIAELYTAMYGEERFVRLLAPGTIPATQYVRGSNYCDIGFALDRHTGRIIVMTAIDNIVKGASGQAIQNMNLLCGFPEQTALTAPAFFP